MRRAWHRYAYWGIHAAVHKSAMDGTTGFRLPTSVHQSLSELRKHQARLRATRGVEPSAAELAAACEHRISERRVSELLTYSRAAKSTLSLHRTRGTTTDGVDRPRALPSVSQAWATPWLPPLSHRRAL